MFPFVPPPKDTDPTRAAIGSFLAEEMGLLSAYVVEVMREEWEFGRTSEKTMRCCVPACVRVCQTDRFAEAIDSPANRAALGECEAQASADGVFGVPTFVVGTEVFWGNDRLDFLAEHLDGLRLA